MHRRSISDKVCLFLQAPFGLNSQLVTTCDNVRQFVTAYDNFQKSKYKKFKKKSIVSKIPLLATFDEKTA